MSKKIVRIRQNTLVTGQTLIVQCLYPKSLKKTLKELKIEYSIFWYKKRKSRLVLFKRSFCVRRIAQRHYSTIYHLLFFFYYILSRVSMRRWWSYWAPPRRWSSSTRRTSGTTSPCLTFTRSYFLSPSLSYLRSPISSLPSSLFLPPSMNMHRTLAACHSHRRLILSSDSLNHSFPFSSFSLFFFLFLSFRLSMSFPLEISLFTFRKLEKSLFTFRKL